MEVVLMEKQSLRSPLIWSWKTKINESLYDNENDDEDSLGTVGRCSCSRISKKIISLHNVFIYSILQFSKEYFRIGFPVVWRNICC